jgi:hypothetical protein
VPSQLSFSAARFTSRVILSAAKRALCARRGGDPYSLLTSFDLTPADAPDYVPILKLNCTLDFY